MQYQFEGTKNLNRCLKLLLYVIQPYLELFISKTKPEIGNIAVVCRLILERENYSIALTHCVGLINCKHHRH